MGLFDLDDFDMPEEKKRKRQYKEEMKNLLESMEPTGKITLTAKWDDNLGVILIGATKLGTLIRYETIKSVEVEQEVKLITESKGETKKKGVVKRSIVGGVLFGPAGAIIGGATAKEKTNVQAQTRQEIIRTLVVTRDDPYKPVLRFSYDANLEKKLRDILAQNQAKEIPTVQATYIEQKNDVPNLIADELIKLKQLMDQGILSQEEFDQQKEKLLNR